MLAYPLPGFCSNGLYWLLLATFGSRKSHKRLTQVQGGFPASYTWGSSHPYKWPYKKGNWDFNNQWSYKLTYITGRGSPCWRMISGLPRLMTIGWNYPPPRMPVTTRIMNHF